ncbi:hypothetical protein Q7C36_002191 [Tachysurus vachellii]|uniref:Uncharacterized protein n=1 Tax=Tachysurus vachellii TaxID=175792 RepID=A0AA88TAG7_TACVA|nr:hypothetical protein Q7C36_002191 [Tachysurus vachellii]
MDALTSLQLHGLIHRKNGYREINKLHHSGLRTYPCYTKGAEFDRLVAKVRELSVPPPEEGGEEEFSSLLRGENRQTDRQRYV